jgi:glycerophosphoryl diester phosphodiesterase
MAASRRTKFAAAALAGVAAATTGGMAASAAPAASPAPTKVAPFVAPDTARPIPQRFDLEGHRGTRGLRPENTLPAFAKALDIGVRTLELDTGVTKDGVVVVSHDPFINPLLCVDTAPVKKNDPKYPYVGKNIVDLTFAQVETLDCGTRNPAVPATDPFYASQLPVPGTRIPTLDQVFALVEARHADDVQLNIETKIDPTQPKQTVGPDAFVRADLAVIRRHRNGIARSLLQSFDWRTLKIARDLAPNLRRVALVDASTALVGKPGKSPWLGGIDVDAYPYHGDIPYAARSVGATVVSPDQLLVDSAFVASAHRHHELVVPYTVDAVRDMQKLIGLGVDGIITDYPDFGRDVLGSLGYRLPKRYPAV